MNRFGAGLGALCAADADNLIGEDEHISAFDAVGRLHRVEILRGVVAILVCAAMDVFHEQGLALAVGLAHVGQNDAIGDVDAAIAREIAVGQRVDEKKIIEVRNSPQRIPSIEFALENTGVNTLHELIERKPIVVFRQPIAQPDRGNRRTIEELLDKCRSLALVFHSLSEHILLVEDFDAIFSENTRERIVLGLRFLQKRRVLEEHLLQMKGMHSLKLIARTMKHDFLQRTDFRINLDHGVPYLKKTILKDGKIHSRPWDSTKV